MTPEKHPETTMKRHRLTEAEERRLAEAIAAEARAMGLTKKDKMPQETKRRLRARILKAILDERTASKNREATLTAGQAPDDTLTWQPLRRR
ncbi:TPA: hypothetical protein PPE95_005049 [Escherichia coli]|nr:hypothetical protein [Escherichia coli]HCA6357730.1 hypothetical protein [Escherichia coli]HDE3065121.1 hypothetical protein [Escherichia coli]HDI8768056.1 hypothetical protein [Escherichia coli]